MRKNVEIVWLEDNINDVDHEERVEHVEEKIKEKGYVPNIITAPTLQIAQELILNPETRIDFFVSDYNLGENEKGEPETGLDYLLEVRKNKSFKEFFILYSNNTKETITAGLIEKLNEEKINTNLFSNFAFISLDASLVQIENEFSNAIDTCLSRWDELNAIRGMYMYEHAELEYELRDKLRIKSEERIDYKVLFNRFKSNFKQQSSLYKNKNLKRVFDDIFADWDNSIEERNLLAHAKEKYDSQAGFFLQSELNNRVKLHENQLDKKRRELVKLKEIALKIIKEPGRVTSYVSNTKVS
ncbi:MAG: hypothetical protein FWE07_06830 [Turicibacter sp.]|nr:hypothetical protein [Turicibacter sp.]